MRVYNEMDGRIAFVTDSDTAQPDLDAEFTSFVHPGPVDPLTDWVPSPGVVEPIPASGIPTDIATAKAVKMRELKDASDAHKMAGVEVVITYEQATVPLGSYWCKTTDTAFSSMGVLRQRLNAIPSGDTVILETMNEEILDVDSNTFGFFYLRIFGHHQWSDAARRDVANQIDASTDPGLMDIPALYATAYANAKPPGEY